MGEVYRCRDPKLGRDVAIKTLPAELAHDPGRLSRFRGEARTLAALNHPGIAAIHGLEESGLGVRQSLGRYEDLFRAYRTSFESQHDGKVVDALDRGHAEGGYRRGLHLAADTLAARVGPGRGHVDPVPIVEIYQYAGDGERAMEWMEHMLAQHDPNAPGAALLPVPDELRRSSRFRSIRERMGLPAL
jgi:serine/threonine protein kinase